MACRAPLGSIWRAFGGSARMRSGSWWDRRCAGRICARSLTRLRDLERLSAQARAGGRVARAICWAILPDHGRRATPELHGLLVGLPSARLAELREKLLGLGGLAQRLERALADEVPVAVKDGRAWCAPDTPPTSTSCRSALARQQEPPLAGARSHRAQAHRNRLAQDPFQPRLRLLPRSHDPEPAARAARLHPAPDRRGW